ncbi:phosphoribosylglycinamide formyltransferase [Emcibacter nanhaiensis]|uniref:Phosphoribosylglycinamide formyltransferase n=1 Tax=Emcibacter nanhaiensis TaxID=1505037 RepID=A0A501PRL7_9PROT|nr:phosphoribosylglycinamide formyltransferase [Emcibacter nanhaiensis]TPD63093.1 phosphoribosylglycinamide formyltransferase [Emcibacter nanhaiensis]
MLDVAVLVSGRGSNLQALIDACADEDFPARIVRVISNNPDAYGLERARQANIPTSVINHRDYDSKEAFEEALDKELNACKAKMICLAGFMRILEARFVNRWKDRILNIHPSLLPSFKGLHTHERALESGVRFTGCTVHIVRPEMDDGPIILQAAVAVNPDETADELAARILEYEHIIYPEALRLMASGKARIAGDKVIIESAAYPDGGWINPLPGDDLEL